MMLINNLTARLHINELFKFTQYCLYILNMFAVCKYIFNHDGNDNDDNDIQQLYTLKPLRIDWLRYSTLCNETIQ